MVYCSSSTSLTENIVNLFFCIENYTLVLLILFLLFNLLGAAIIRMMNHFLGEDVFKKGLISFLKKYENGNADRNDLFNSLTEEAHKVPVLLPNETVKQIMDTWTERPGFPVIHAIADYPRKKLRLIQVYYYT